MIKIDDYATIVGQTKIDELYFLAEKLEGKVIQNINSTSVGGGVAEILTRMIPLLRELGVNAKWDVIKGNEKFFRITKIIHNALHGVDEEISSEDLEYFRRANLQNAEEIGLYGDVIFVHDPQPIALVDKKNGGKKWVWRCHVDLSGPKSEVMNFLKYYIEKYDCAVFSAPAFSTDLNIPQIMIPPSIDPLSDKNKELSQESIDSVIERFGIDKDKPIITQISRFDRLKDPMGVIEVYKRVKTQFDCQLVLAGGGAIDDPEGFKVHEEVKSVAADDPDIHVIFHPPASDIEINALQRMSTVVLQKSLKEGFGLTVAEALWKARPVVASAVGGIPLQVVHEYSGFLTYSVEGTAHYLRMLLNEPEYARTIGLNGRKHVKNNFLITRHIRDYLALFISLYHEDDIIHL